MNGARSLAFALGALGLGALPLGACHRHTDGSDGSAQASSGPDGQAPHGPGAPAGGRQTPSGLPVPRYVSLKFDKVNARGGPGDDYDLKWVYRVKGLPLQVVAETEEWRRVCDAQGALSWVHRRTTDARRTVMRTSADPLPLRARPASDAPEVATLVGHSIAELKSCTGDWCRVAVGRASGWAPASELWGLTPTPQCR